MAILAQRQLRSSRPVTGRTLSLLSAAAAGYLVGTAPSAAIVARA